MTEEVEDSLPAVRKSIRFYRMVTGEDVIAEEVPLINDKVFLIKNPLKIVYMPSPRSPGSMIMSFGSWIFKSIIDDQTFELQKHNVILTGEPDDIVRGHYIESVATMLEAPSKAKKTDIVTEMDMTSIAEAFDRLTEALAQEGVVTPESAEEAENFVNDWFKNASANNKGKLN